MSTKSNISAHKYYILYKPYNVLNQFTKERPEHITLADFLHVDKDVYPVGRLDKDSEGLVLLTNDKSLNSQVLNPAFGHSRTYFVQVDGDITPEAIDKASAGVMIKLDSGPYKTQPCTIKKLSKAPAIPERNPPVRFRKLIPTSWIKIELKEGKNRQIRKMMAGVGFPVLRLVRVQMEELRLGKLQPGEYAEIQPKEIFKLLKIEPKSIEKKEISTELKPKAPKKPLLKNKQPSKTSNKSLKSTGKPVFKREKRK